MEHTRWRRLVSIERLQRLAIAFLAATAVGASAAPAVAAAPDGRPVILDRWIALADYTDFSKQGGPIEGGITVKAAVRNATRVSWSVQDPLLGTIVLQSRGRITGHNDGSANEESQLTHSTLGPCHGGWSASEFHRSRMPSPWSHAPKHLCSYDLWAGTTTNGTFAEAYARQVREIAGANRGPSPREVVTACNQSGCVSRRLDRRLTRWIALWNPQETAAYIYP